jgi:hypothetical protein
MCVCSSPVRSSSNRRRRGAQGVDARCRRGRPHRAATRPSTAQVPPNPAPDGVEFCDNGGTHRLRGELGHVV